jgi:hypothetical protein
VEEDIYATTPMLTVKPAFQALDEETMYISFEEAISARLLALQWRLGRTSDALLNVQRDTDPIVGLNSSAKKAASTVSVEHAPHANRLRLTGRLRRALIFGGLALMFTLLGFDLMGLLVLHMR